MKSVNVIEKPIHDKLTKRERMFVEHYALNGNAKEAQEYSGVEGKDPKRIVKRLRLHIDEEKKRLIAIQRVQNKSLQDFIVDTSKQLKDNVATVDEIKAILTTIIRGYEFDLIGTKDLLSAITLYHRISCMTPYETERIEIEKQKLEIERSRFITSAEEVSDDGFLKALNKSAIDVWGEVVEDADPE